MTKKEAREKTIKRFTNLIDGKVVSHGSVSNILNYYESLINDSKVEIKSENNILNKFKQEYINYIEKNTNNYL